MRYRIHPARLVPAMLALLLPAWAAAQPVTPDRAYMDTTCAPCRDFFQYANGTWFKTAVMPGAYASIGSSRDMADRNQDALLRVLDHAAQNVVNEQDPTVKKIGWLYTVLMDSARADREGAAPVA